MASVMASVIYHEQVVGCVMLCCHGTVSPASRVTVENAFLEEKEDACNALGEIAAQTG